MNKYLKTVKSMLLAGIIAIIGSLTAISPLVHGASISGNVCDGVEAAGGECGNYNINSVWDSVYTVVNWILIATGILAVVFIIVGGIRYVTSGGNPDKTKTAKLTIIYSVIGLAVAILASVIVQVVFNASNTIF